MINPVTNLIVSSQSTDTITFEFDIHTGNIGGYWLWKSLDNGNTYIKTDFKVDSLITSEGIKTSNSGTKTYYSYTLSEKDYGREVYFYITATSTTWEESIPSTIISAFTTPNSPINFLAAFDNYICNLSWNTPSKNDGKNVAISNYGIYRGTFISVGKGTITDNIITNALLTLGSRYLIIDKQKKSIWYGIVESTNSTVTLSTENLYYVADTSEDYTTTADSIEIFIYNNDLGLLSYTTDTTFIDDTVKKNAVYLYAVAAIGYSNNYSSLVYLPLLSPDLSRTTPYLRYVGNSVNTFLSNKYWRILKELLIDKNYYNKNQFAIPYLANETYNFKGYLGVANCNLDVFLNDTFNLSVITDSYGNFEFNVILNKGDNLIQLQARDYKNISFSNKSTRYNVVTTNIYTFFSAIGQEYVDIWDEITLQQIDASFQDSRYISLSNKLTPLLDIYKDISETDANFRNIITAIYNSYIYGGFNEGLNMFFEALKNYAPEIDGYKIFYNNSMYDTFTTNLMPMVSGVQLSSTGLVRDKYWYAVTSANEIGEETDAIIISCDTRWWPMTTGVFGQIEYKGYNVLQWDEATGVNFYKIYKYVGSQYTNINDFEYLTTAFGNLYIDNGNTPTTSKNPPPYNITNLSKPSNLRVIYDINVANQFMALRKRNWMNIFIFSLNDMEVLKFQTDRIKKVCADLIPPEIGYDIILARDSAVGNVTEILPIVLTEKIFNIKGSPSSGIILDITGEFDNFDISEYGLLTYDDSYYDSHTYEYLTALYETQVYNNSSDIKQMILTWQSLSPYVKIYYRELKNYTISQYRNYTVTDWINIFTGVGTCEFTINPLKDIQFKFIFDSPFWNEYEFVILENTTVV
jgi:hypothetical protein